VRVLLVEDNAGFAQSVEVGLSDIDGCSLEWVTNRDDAINRLDNGSFDLVLLDRSIEPNSEVNFNDNVSYGWEVFLHAKLTQQGTPVWFLTAYWDVDLASLLANEHPRTDDLYATGQISNLYRGARKADLPQEVVRIAALADAKRTLSAIPVNYVGQNILPDEREKTIVRQLAKRKHAAAVKVKSFTNGLSVARVLKVDVLNANQEVIGTFVGKIDSIPNIRRESNKHSDIFSLLDHGAVPNNSDIVTCCAGNIGGVFFDMIGGETFSLFDKLRMNPEDAADIPAILEGKQSKWQSVAAQEIQTVGDIRRRFIRDTVIAQLGPELPAFARQYVEDIEVSVNVCFQHRDLHAGNILFAPNDDVLMIDYFEANRDCVCLDSVTLELSLLFHSESLGIRGDWPGIELVEQWFDVESYLTGCPFPELVRSCRSWSERHATSAKEIAAIVYSYAIRQLKYDDTDKDLARALILAAVARLSVQNQ
jgi:CheY-like chemotaxis protein